MGIAHVTFNFGAWRKCRYRVDNHNIDSARTHHHVADFEGLFARIGLGDQQIFGIYAEIFSVDRVKRVLRIDKGAGAAHLLSLGDNLQRKRGFTR